MNQFLTAVISLNPTVLVYAKLKCKHFTHLVFLSKLYQSEGLYFVENLSFKINTPVHVDCFFRTVKFDQFSFRIGVIRLDLF